MLYIDFWIIKWGNYKYKEKRNIIWFNYRISSTANNSNYVGEYEKNINNWCVWYNWKKCYKVFIICGLLWQNWKIIFSQSIRAGVIISFKRIIIGIVVWWKCRYAAAKCPFLLLWPWLFYKCFYKFYPSRFLSTATIINKNFFNYICLLENFE